MEIVTNLITGLYGTGSIAGVITDWASAAAVPRGGYREYTDGFVYQCGVTIEAASPNSYIAPPLNPEVWTLIRSIYTSFSTTAPESYYNDWTTGVAHAPGDTVFDDYDLNDYVCLNSHTSGTTDATKRPSEHLRTETGIETPNWVLKGRGNAFRMFDGETLTRTRDDDTLVCTFLTSAACDTLLVFGLRGVSAVEIQALDGSGGDLGAAQNVSTQYAVDTGNYAGSARIDLSTTGATRYELTLTKLAGEALVECGLVVAGVATDLGATEIQASLGGLSYSRTAADEFGQRVLVPRGFSRELRARVRVDQARLDYATQRLMRVMGTAVAMDLNNGGTSYEQLRVWGLLRDVTGVYTSWAQAPCVLDLTLESLVED